MLSPTECAYIAGFIDGEGTIGIWRERRLANRSGWTYKAVIQISNTHRGVLEWIKAVSDCGGWISHSNRERPLHKPLYKLTFGVNGVRTLLPQLLPHLHVKAEQAKAVMAFLDRIYQGCNQNLDVCDAFYKECRILNTRGSAQRTPIP